MKKLKILVVILAAAIVAGNVLLTLRSAAADKKAPELNVPGDSLKLSIEAEESEYLKGVTANDNRDGDLTDQVFIEHISQLTGDNTVTVTYGVFDAAGNAATASRSVIYEDYKGPTFSLAQPLRYPVGSMVTLKDRLSATDPLDGDISGNIRMTNVSLSNDTPGVYRIRVQVTNSLADTRMLTLPIIIAEDTPATPSIVLSDYIVYVKTGEKFDANKFISSVTDPASEKRAKKADVTVKTDADLKTPGTYDVEYSYQGEEESVSVILTLVVE